MSLTKLLKNLQHAELFPHPVRYFKLIETHISAIILTGEYAYKIKKPLNLGFLDFTTLAQRHQYCQAELELNQRTAPEIYVELIAITGSEDHPNLNGSGEIIDYAIKMREFPQTALFDELLNNQQLSPELIDATAIMLADFHQQSSREAPDDSLGSPENIEQFVQQNFAQIIPLLHEPSDLNLLHEMQDWATQQQKILYPTLAQRKAQGFIRACHGDVHLKNIALIAGKPTLFDCIEFNPALQWTDTMADLGFLSMDLQDKGNVAYARQLINTYLEYSGDYSGLAVLRYYQHYRAMVRAKIALFNLTTPNLSTAEQAETLRSYRQKIQLAATYTKNNKTFLAITHGVAGSGKSTLAQQLINAFDAIQIRSDIERKRLANLGLLTRTINDVNAGLYAPEITQKIYQHLLTLTQSLLHMGYSVIVDATFLQLTQRQLFFNLAKQLDIDFFILACETEDTILQQRVQQRSTQILSHSDATIEVLNMQKINLETPTEIEQTCTIECDTTQINAISEVIQQLKSLLTTL